MNIEKLAKEAIIEIKEKYEIPSEGFLSGGSIANIIWEKVSGNKAVINDIDIYQLVEIKDRKHFYKSKQHWQSNKLELIEYKFMDEEVYECSFYGIDKFYQIESVERNGILNFIKYSSNFEDLKIILESFDINCCQVGYDIKNDIVYYTDDFREFLETGKLKITSCSSPSHSILRLIKKSDELKAEYNDQDIDILSYVLGGRKSTSNILKIKFKQKYYNIFQKYKHLLIDRFNIIGTKCPFEDESIIWEMKCKKTPTMFDDVNFSSCRRKQKDFIFYVREIRGNNRLEKLWENFSELSNCKLEYFDYDPTEEETTLVKSYITKSNVIVNSLNGLTLSEQIRYLKLIGEKFKHEETCVSILQRYNVKEAFEADELESTIMEIKVRNKLRKFYR